MFYRSGLKMVAAAAGVLLAQAADAHSMGAQGGAFASGLVHPFAGLDHVLAMVAIGVWAAQNGGRALWAVPLSFVATMLLGAALGIAGMPLPSVEPAIAVSLMILGLLVTLSVRMRLAAGMAVAAVFALFHGHAHGTEIITVSIAQYLLGMTIATALLHGAGMIFGSLPKAGFGAKVLRFGGAAIAATGAWMLVGP